MDPNETLRRILAANGRIGTDEFDQAVEDCENLASWLRNGGFAPNVPIDAKYWPGTNTPYAVLNPMRDTSYKWLFVIYDTKGDRAEFWELNAE